MLDHIGLTVADYARSKRFYEQALAPLGYRCLMEFEGKVGGFGQGAKPDFWISQGTRPAPGVHVAFASADRETVKRFHAAAISGGGQDNGAPGIRPEYHPHYFGAFVLDPDGHNVEAVCHRPES